MRACVRVCVHPSYLVVGAEVEQPPRGVHEVGEVVQEAQASPHRLHAHLPQPAVLRGHGPRQAQLQGHRGAWGVRRGEESVNRSKRMMERILEVCYDLNLR